MKTMAILNTAGVQANRGLAGVIAKENFVQKLSLHVALGIFPKMPSRLPAMGLLIRWY
tara:strand:+ start:1425 stop:1598 length:174 start_codon:yes stop_codon:yes gene_type:complete